MKSFAQTERLSENPRKHFAFPNKKLLKTSILKSSFFKHFLCLENELFVFIKIKFLLIKNVKIVDFLYKVLDENTEMW